MVRGKAAGDDPRDDDGGRRCDREADSEGVGERPSRGIEDIMML